MHNFHNYVVVFLGCGQQKTTPCKDIPCNAVYDGDNTTCVSVPHNISPWSLHVHLQVGCIPLKYNGSFKVDIIGKGLLCDRNSIYVAYQENKMYKSADVLEDKNFKLCHVIGYEGGGIDSVITCHFACENASGTPKVLLVDIFGDSMELCEVTYVNA